MKQPSISTRSQSRVSMQGASLNVVLVTPEAELFNGKAGQVTLPSSTGQIEILPNHEATLVSFDDGVVQIGKESFALNGAVADIGDNSVVIMAK